MHHEIPLLSQIAQTTSAVPVSMTVHEVIECELLQRDPKPECDCFGIMEDGRCSGIASVTDLMMTISGGQSRLLENLEQLSRRIRREVEMGQPACRSK